MKPAPKRASKAQIISFHCVLSDPLGKVISSSFNHDVLTRVRTPSLTAGRGIPLSNHFDFHEPLEELVEGLKGVKKGDRRKIFVSAERAYGLYDPELVMQVSRKRFAQGEDLAIGFQVVTQSDDGESRVFRIIDADGATVTLDGNHPLAGQDLCFDIETTAARDATAEELAQGKPSKNAPNLH